VIKVTQPKRRYIVLAAAIVVISIILGATRLGHAGRTPPPGTTAGVSALDKLPAQASIPAQVQDFLTSYARATNTPEAQARAGIRLLRSDLGSRHASVYAFRSRAGSVCFILTGLSATCAHKASDGTPGMHWMVGGGDAISPSALIGIASDDVKSVTLTVDGASIAVSLKNNVAYGEFPAAAQTAGVHINRADGSVSTVQVHLQG
jgi:hypothetical protein